MSQPMERLYDMHCHLGSMANADQVADEAESLGITLLNMTVSPVDAVECERLASHPNVRLAHGLHPWWVADGTCGEADIARAAITCAASRYVGEIGLDYSAARASSAPQQLEAFEWIIEACAERRVQGRVVSIHAVRAASETLDVLQRFDLPHSAACVFHWFSGTGEDLVRARKMGCYFSVSARMLATKRGREYARQIPKDKLLLETDAPREFGSAGSGAELHDELSQALETLAEVRGEGMEPLADRIRQTSQGLMQ